MRTDLVGGEDAVVLVTEQIDRLLVGLLCAVELKVTDQGSKRIRIQFGLDTVDLLLRGNAVRTGGHLRQRAAHIDLHLGAIGPEGAHRADL